MKSIAEKVIEVVKKETGTEELFLSHVRKQNVVAARIIAARIIKEHTCLGEQDIAKLLGKDKASVHYYLASFRRRYYYEKNFRTMYETCMTHIKEIL